MNTPAVLSKRQATSVFNAAAKGTKPARMKPLSVQERLAPFAPILRSYYDRGYTLEQLADILRDPSIGLKVKPHAVKALLDLESKSTLAPAASPVAPAVLPAASSPSSRKKPAAAPTGTSTAPASAPTPSVSPSAN